MPSREGAVRAAFGRLTFTTMLAFIVSIPAEYALVLPGVGSVSRLLGLSLMLLVFLDILGGRMLRTPGATLFCFAAFTAWSALTVAWSVEPAQTLERIVTYVQLLVMAWVVCEYVRTESDFCNVLSCFVAGALFMACMTIREFSVANFAAAVLSDRRVSAFGANPNELGLTLAVTLPPALYMLMTSRSGLLRVLGGVYLITGPVAVLLSASRSAVIVLVLTLPGVALMMRDASRRMKFVMVLAAVTAVVVVASFVPTNTWDRLATIGANLQRMDLNNRTDNWRAGIEYSMNNPFLGVGAGAFLGAATHLRTVAWSSHSTWVGVLVETGFIGASLFYGAVGLSLLGLRRANRTIRTLLLSMVLPMMVGMMVTGWDHRKVPWFVFSLLVVAPLLKSSRLPAPAFGAS